MKPVSSYIPASDRRDFCEKCCEICSRHCVIWRKASSRYDEEEKKEAVNER